jgi:hypothetical protein
MPTSQAVYKTYVQQKDKKASVTNNQFHHHKSSTRQCLSE